VGLYITNDLQTSADTFILRVKSRYLWWLSKIVWCVVSSTLYYLFCTNRRITFNDIFRKKQ
jgi:hypothetical protein